MLPQQLAGGNWTHDTWDELEQLARDIVDQRARLRHAIPRGPDAIGAYSIVIPEHVPGGELSRDLSKTAPPIRLERRFKLLSEQMEDRDAVRALVERSARLLAVDEDRALLVGATVKTVVLDGLTDGNATVTGGVASSAAPVAPAANDVLAIARAAVLALETGGLPFTQPFHIVWSDQAWARELDKAKPDYRRGQREALQHLLGHGGSIISLPQTAPANDTAVLFSPDPIAIDLVFAEYPTIALVEYKDGDVVLRVEERLRLRVVDRAVIQVLKLQ